MKTKTPHMKVIYRNPEKNQISPVENTTRLQKDIFDCQPPRPELFYQPRLPELWFCRRMFGFAACDNYLMAKEFLLDNGIDAVPRLCIVYDRDDSSFPGTPVWLFEDENGLRTLPVFNGDRNFMHLSEIFHPTYVEISSGEYIEIYGLCCMVADLPGIGKTLLRLRAFFHAKLAAQLAWTQYGEEMEFVLAKMYAPNGFHHYLGTYWIGRNHENGNTLYLPFLTTMQKPLKSEVNLNEVPRSGLDRDETFRLYRTDYKVFGNPGKINGYHVLPATFL